MWVRYQPDSASQRFGSASRVGSESAAGPPQSSIVALAKPPPRKLLIALWRYVTHGEIPAGAVMKPV